MSRTPTHSPVSNLLEELKRNNAALQERADRLERQLTRLDGLLQLKAREQTRSLLSTQVELDAQFGRLAECSPDVICRYDLQCRLV